MKMLDCGRIVILLLVSFSGGSSAGLFAQAAQAGTPRLERRGQAMQLVVDGKPFVMLAGELHNSSSSNLAYMMPEWAQLRAMGLNTVFTPVSWELVEPVEGKYDFALVDGLLAQARAEKMHLVFLWLAAWKNGMSSYPPAWVKADTRRFPRVVEKGQPVEILSTLAPATAEADGRAFAALMKHLSEVDAQDHTVLMMQVENEVGVLGATRDHSEAADKAFAGQVPAELLRSLEAHHSALNEELRTLWEANGTRPRGTWTEVFGDSARTDELFMAWNYGRYVQGVTAKGKAAYGIPMYVNAWLGGGDTTPGNYPSGGPQPRVIDVWKAAGTAIDLFCPDLYASDMAGWSTRYHRPDNPLMIPETNGGAVGAANVFYALGEHAAIGFSPFAIDAGMHGEAGPYAEAANKGRVELAASYKVLGSMLPELAEAETRGDVHGFVLSKEHPSVEFVMHGVTVEVSLDQIFGSHAEAGFGLILQEGPETFLGAGKGFRVRFEPRDPAAPRLGVASVDEGTFEDGKWVSGRRLNGDENDQGAYWRFDWQSVKLERTALYRLR